MAGWMRVVTSGFPLVREAGRMVLPIGMFKEQYLEGSLMFIPEDFVDE